MFVKACLNGGRSRAEHPAVPVAPAEPAAEARGAGLQVRVGLEDTLVHADGRLSAGDADLVAAARALA